MSRQTTVKYTGNKGFSLIEILLVIALLAIVGGGVAFYYAGRSKPTDKVQKPITRAESVVCMQNLRSVRQAIAAAQASDTDGKFPQSLSEMKELPAEVTHCDVGKEAYVYDPTTGQVHCPHPGHENY